MLYLDNGAFRINHPEIKHGTNVHGDIIAGDNVLCGDVIGDDTQINTYHLLNHWNHDNQAGPLDLLKTAQEENDATLVFFQNAYSRDNNSEQ